MRVLFIDPGPEELGWCLFDTETELPIEFGIEGVEPFRNRVRYIDADAMGIERIVAYGKTANQTLYDTQFESGRLADRWERLTKKPWFFLSRVDVKNALCGASAGVNDTAIRDEIRYRYNLKHRLCKKWPAPFTGLDKHALAAFAGALAWWELEKARKARRDRRRKARAAAR